MLAIMRKNAKNWFIKVLLFMIIIVFVAYFGTTKGKEMAEPIVTIDGKAISYGDYYKEYQNLLEIYRKQLGGNLTDQALKELNLKQMAFDSVVHSAIIQKKAEEMNLKVTEEEVKAAIMSYPAFQANGVFDDRTYQQALRQNKLTPEEFEIMQRKGMTTMKLELLIQGGVKVSDREAFDLYRFQNERINVAFVRLSPRDQGNKVAFKDQDLESYLKDHGDEFRVTDQIQMKYLVFPGEAYQGSVKISDSDVTDYYNRNRSELASKSKDKKTVPPLSEVRDRIIAELRKVNGMYGAYDSAKKAHDTIYQEEKMEAYAGHHKLTVQATGFFSSANPPGEFKGIKDFSKTVFALQKGDISPVVSDDRAYYVFRIEDKRPAYTPALKDIRGDVERRYVASESRRLTEKDAEAIIGRMKKGENLAAIARDKGLKIEETGLFIPGSTIPKLGASKDLGEAIYQLSERKTSTDTPFFIDGSYTVVQFKERGALDNSEFAAKKDATKVLLYRMKVKETIQSWIEGTKTAMIKSGRLKIKKEVKEL